MPRSKTTESRNSFTGVRKLSKNSIKKTKKGTDTNTTEEMLDILSSESNFKGAQQPMQPQNMGQTINNNEVDPLMVSNYVPTNDQGQILDNFNKIGDLLGMTQIGNPVLSTDSTVQNPITAQQNPMAQQLTSQLMQQQMMPQQMMPQQMQQPMMPQQMQQPMNQFMGQPMNQFMGQPMMQDSIGENTIIDNIKNLSGLYKVPKLA
jgi:hypothetical protein